MNTNFNFNNPLSQSLPACSACGAGISEVMKRYSLQDSVERTIWSAPNEMPEVDVAYAEDMATFCCEAHAMQGVDDHMKALGGRPTWADVRPLEECAVCGCDFDTNSRHHAMVLVCETGEALEPQMLDLKYAARICGTCNPA